MRVPLRCSGAEERGAVALLVSLITLVLLGLSAFAADFGMAYAQRQALATGVDSAVLDIAHDLRRELLVSPTDCDGLATSEHESAAHGTAVERMNDNAPFGQEISDRQVEAELECVGHDDNVLQIEVAVEHGVDTILGGLFGVSRLDVSREAGANLGVANGVVGLRPIGVCKAQALEIIKNARADLAAGLPHRAERIAPEKVWTGANRCSNGNGSGNWGWIEFPEQQNGTRSLGEIIANGYSRRFFLTEGTYTIGGTPGNKGNSSQVGGGMAAIMDEVVTLPVYAHVTANGNSTTYTIAGFLTVRMCGYSTNQRGACYDASDAGVALRGDDLQVRFVEYSPAGIIDDWCELDDPCAYNSYVTGLTR